MNCSYSRQYRTVGGISLSSERLHGYHQSLLPFSSQFCILYFPFPALSTPFAKLSLPPCTPEPKLSKASPTGLAASPVALVTVWPSPPPAAPTTPPTVRESPPAVLPTVDVVYRPSTQLCIKHFKEGHGNGQDIQIQPPQRDH